MTSTVMGSFNYQSGSVLRSLYSTGNVFLDRDTTGTDNEPVGLDPTPTEVPVHDGRSLGMTLDRNGFVLTPHVYDHINYMEEEEIVSKYYPEVCRFVKEHMGADRVIAFDHNVRSSKTKSWMNKEAEAAAPQQIKGGNFVQSPAQVVHNDYTLTSAPQRLHMLTQPAKVNDTWKNIVPEGAPLISPDELVARMGSKRWAMVNVWRSISDQPVQDMPLALCDGDTITKDDLITFEIRYSDRVGENYFAKHSSGHRWVYFPRMVKDEAIILKVWDSESTFLHNDAVPVPTGEAASSASTTANVSCFSLHSAFKDPRAAPDCPHRESIEIRTVVFY